MNNFFINITKDWELKEDNNSNADTLEDVLKVLKVNQVFKELGEKLKLMKKFCFQQVTEDLVQKIVLNLDSFKATPVWEIPVDMLKYCWYTSSFITKTINSSFENLFWSKTCWS